MVQVRGVCSASTRHWWKHPAARKQLGINGCECLWAQHGSGDVQTDPESLLNSPLCWNSDLPHWVTQRGTPSVLVWPLNMHCPHTINKNRKSYQRVHEEQLGTGLGIPGWQRACPSQIRPWDQSLARKTKLKLKLGRKEKLFNLIKITY